MLSPKEFGRDKTIQLLILGAYISLAEIIPHQKPLESIRLVEAALAIDNTQENAYKIQMKTYLIKGNCPQTIKAYMKCEIVLKEEYGVTPLPERAVT